jgi:hypothetical protein
MRGISIEVTTIGVPSCATQLLLGLGFSQNKNCAITPYSLYPSLIVEVDYGKNLLYLKASNITLVYAHLLYNKISPP